MSIKALARYALVIGITGYPSEPLRNATADACRVAEVLRQRGFETDLLLDAAASTIDSAIALFRDNATGADIAIVYLAGHAVERYGVGYFLPCDFPFPLSPSGAKQFGISLNDVVQATQSARSGIVMLDACRNWPPDLFEQSRLNTDFDELASCERSWHNVLLAYSTSASTVASDGVSGEGSAFSRALCRHVLDHSLTADECFRRVTQDVTQSSKWGQQPWTYSSLKQTITFSDLPRLAPLQRHILPGRSQTRYSWCVPNNTGTGVFAGLGDERAWHVDLGGLSSISFTSTTELVGAAHLFGDRLYFAGSQGEILCTGESVNAVLTLDVSPSLGLVTSPDQLGFVHIGGRTATVFRLEGTILAQVAQIQVDFDIYCCAYRSNLNICFAGAQGRIAVLDLADSESPVRHIASIGAHINAMTISPDGRTLFCGGQSGLLAAVSIDGGAPPSLIPKRRPQTAAGVRAALIDFAGDEIIRQFIFAPDTLEAPLRDKLEKTTGYSSILSCVLMPGSPILAAGTDESTVILFDTRDWQIIQQIDMTSGFPTVVTGLIFTADLNLVAMDASGQILFLGQLKQSGNFVS